MLADMSELNLAKGTTIDFPQGKDKLLIFQITIKPDEGYYRQMSGRCCCREETLHAADTMTALQDWAVRVQL